MNTKFQIFIFGLVTLLVLLIVEAAPPSEPTTRSPISDEDLEASLKDKRYLQRQLKCALGEAPCDPVGRRLKSLAPLVLQGSCPQCTPTEQRQIRTVLAYVQVHFPKEWNKILHQYSG